jgi:hypothetical protein
MGRIKKGILGGFSGKVGTVVGANWKSISYMRSLPQKVKNPRTLPQLKQRSKFTLVVNLLRPMLPLLRVGWKQYAHGRQSAFNAATSYTLANAIIGEYPDYKIDPKKVMISRGTLTSPNNATGGRRRNHIHTLGRQHRRWAPPIENNTESYIAQVEKWSGIARNKQLTAADGGDYILIVAAMSFMENGVNADISEVKAGFNLQNKITMP